jgi:hypothetical protein
LTYKIIYFKVVGVSLFSDKLIVNGAGELDNALIMILEYLDYPNNYRLASNENFVGTHYFGTPRLLGNKLS